MTAPSPGRVTYRQVLAVREFRALFLADGLSVLGDQVARLAVAFLVFERTQSPLAAAATYAVSYLTWLVGGPLLSALPDRYPRREVMLACDLGRMVLIALLAVPGLPLAAFFVVLCLVGLLAPPFDSARSALIADILDGEAYVVGNALSNAVAQGGQVLGFVAGGVLVAGIGVQAALLVDAATFAVSALVLLLVVQRRPASTAEPGASLLSEALAGARLVRASPRLLAMLAWGTLSFAAVIGPEGLAVAVSDRLGGGVVGAGVLTAAVPAGFLVGSAVLLRVPTDRRERLFPALMALACLPLVLTPLVDHLAVVAALWLLAGVGNALQLIANAAFVQAVPPELRGRAFGVAGTVVMAVQGVALLAVGGIAERVGPQAAVAVAAAACLVLVPVVAARTGATRSAQAPAGSGRSGPE